MKKQSDRNSVRINKVCPGCADPLSEHDENIGCLRERKTVGDDGYEYSVCRCLLGPKMAEELAYKVTMDKLGES